MIKGMKRTLLLFLVLVSLLAPAQAVAAVKAGDSCKKLNQSATVKGKKYICTKSAKKLVWKAAPVSKPISTPAPSAPEPSKPEEIELELTPPSSAKIGTGCIFPGLFVGLIEGPAACSVLNGKSIWTPLTKENDSVASRAYRFVSEKYSTTPEGNLAMDIRMDPNTPEWGKKIQKGMYAGARFWGTSPSGSAPVPTLISADINWWPAQLDTLNYSGKDEYLKRIAAGTCQAEFHGGPNTFWSFSFRESNCVTNVGFKQVPAHEYTHYAQAVLSNSLSSQKPRVPWMEEGLASFIGGALGSHSDMGSDLRTSWAMDLRSNQAPLDFFSKAERSVYESPKWGEIYPVGAIALEGLVALVGIDGVLTYYSAIKEGLTADQSMVKAFGLTVSNAAKLLDSYVDSVRMKNDWSLEKLQSEWESAKKR